MKQNSWCISQIFLCLTFFFASSGLKGQVITSIPDSVTTADSVIIIFDASKGNRELMGFTGDVYTHTGVITSQSSSSSDWKFVIGDWGNNNAQPQLTNIGGDLWQLDIGDVRTFYGIPLTERILQLAFVFRSADTRKVGRDVGGADIFLDIDDTSFRAGIIQPNIDTRFGDPKRSPVFTNHDDTLKFIAVKPPEASSTLTMTFLVEGIEVSSTTNDSLIYDFLGTNFSTGFHEMAFVVSDTVGVPDTTEFLVMVNPEVNDAPQPAEVVSGINKVDETTVTLSLFAPFKEFVYVIGDFNDWMVDEAYYMNREQVNENETHFWLTLTGLEPNTEYAFQYLVDGDLRIADPYAQKLLDGKNDESIDEATYPNLKPYPINKTEELVSVFQINEPEYKWQSTDYVRPQSKDLVIYELLIRDFIESHNYQTLIDTLGYFERLGINAIELMPVNEFEGNDSWGYNPAFYFAPDKFYGAKKDLKRFIDACHERGIAVILDMVLNHAFGQSSFVRLYNEGGYSRPTPENPWLNVVAKHPFNVGYDFNHESKYTKALVDSVNRFWLREYKIDGFRFDLSKGFTQRNSGNNVGAWGDYDASRIEILTRMANKIWEVDSTSFVILEHFAANDEERVLSDRGMMLWGNMNHAYSESAMGWVSDSSNPSDISGGYYKTRGWTKPSLVTYMESHDEPWLMYKNIEFGRSSSDNSYDIKDIATGLDRIKLVSTFFFTIPGPKMMWQFGELGFDQFLASSGFERIAPKPILWDYYHDVDRRRLYDFISELISLRNRVDLFRDTATSVSIQTKPGQEFRKIILSHTTANVVIVGNFGVEPIFADPGFFHGGIWYDYFMRDSLLVDSNFSGLNLKPGQFGLFSDAFIGFPDSVIITGVQSDNVVHPKQFWLNQNYPNPFNPTTSIEFNLPIASDVKIDIFNITGQKVKTLSNEFLNAGNYTVNWNGLDDNNQDIASGLYFVKMWTQDYSKSIKIIKLK